MVLEKINQPNDIKSLTDEELKILASEIREFLIEKISVTGGHLASNLGVVELTSGFSANTAIRTSETSCPSNLSKEKFLS